MFDIVLNMLSVLVKYNWTLSKLINLQKLELYTITTKKVYTKKALHDLTYLKNIQKYVRWEKCFSCQ